MEVSYNLRYQKQSFGNKVLIDKEGEIIIYAKGFRLKGKGAGDKGELLNFSELKEFYFKDKQIIFITFNKEKYILSEAGTLFEQMLIDLYKSRNTFLADALFMKVGKLKGQYDAYFERISKFGKPISKAKVKLCLYEGSLLLIPELQDVIAVNFNFVNFHEFDDMEYQLKIVMDDGSTIFISQLANDYEFFEEKMNTILGGMYEDYVNGGLKEAFPEFHAGTLLKLGFKMKGGKAVSLKDIKKMDEDMAARVEEFIFEDEVYKEKASVLRELVDDYNIYFGIAKDEKSKDGFVKWALYSIPENNIVAFTILPRWESEEKFHSTYFYKIIMQQGRPAEKAADKIREIEQALVTLKFVKDPCHKDKRDLKHSPYQYAIRKMPFLRILRKSFVGRASAVDVKQWQEQAKKIVTNATLKN
ncbi:hypothetical protein JKY72_00685 [Candidatus Gracilibacteria bacterium]|nr:hypothetical protein [Candidatus Gracilibacteria bacterium]